jgi:hypothetical protein
VAAALPRLRPVVGALSLQIGPTDVASGV